MNKTIHLSCAIVGVMISFAFANPNTALKATYGVSLNDPSQIKLQLNNDFSFTYQDYSNVDKPIDVEGTYKIDGKLIMLNSTSNSSYHNKWKITNDGCRIQSRKGILFYSLVKLSNEH